MISLTLLVVPVPELPARSRQVPLSTSMLTVPGLSVPVYR